ncbi:MBL fold metallo-hydrolase [Actinomadura coerulea]|uniref:MBL fold metallo-hydrolase n=1 Tax=Actinomadura coerulea TaxID=46159 RepID=UPI0034311E99
MTSAGSVTAVPAQHGPDGTEHIVGPVRGFVLQAPDEPVVYVSGDNASLPVVQQVADRFPDIDVAVLFACGARTPVLEAFLTLAGEQSVAAAHILGMPRVHPVHTDGWAHFTEDGRTRRAAFALAGLSHLLLPVRAGVAVAI